jgi:hypothetical protein
VGSSAVTITSDATPVTITPDQPKGRLAQQMSAPQPPGFLDTLEREGSSLGKSIAGIPGAFYHAAADPASDEEKQRFGPNFEHDIGPTGRLIDRMAVQPAMNAYDFYRDAAKGKYGDASAVESGMLDVAPEAMGGAGAAVIAPKIADWAVNDLPSADLPVRRAGSAAWAGTKGALAKVPVAGPMVRSGLKAAIRDWKSTAPTLDSETGLEVSGPRLIQRMGGEPIEQITGRLVLSPEEAQAETQQMSLAKRMASQRGMQYAAGMKPAPPQ